MIKALEFEYKLSNEFILTYTFILIATYVFSLLIAPYHIGGDQVHYNNAYIAVKGLSLLDAYDVYPTIIYTVEPIHFLIIWIFSSVGIEKNALMAVANSILAALFFFTLRRRGNSLPMAVLLLFTSYYLMTMFFTLERTKFAFIFLLMFINSKKAIYLILAIFAHTLILIPVIFHLTATYLVGEKQITLNASRSRKLYFIKFIALSILLYIIFDYFGEHVKDKFLAYSAETQSENLVNGWQIFIMMAMTMLSSNNKKVPFFYFILLFGLALQIGGSRVNMMSYFGFLFYSNATQSNFKIFTLVLSPYFIYKCYVYGDIVVSMGG